jgi:uncharacterized membrane protein HdeD (DUF308 family)
MTVLSTAIGSIKNWWWFIIKGILFIAAGIAVLAKPVDGYVGLSVLFSVVILCIGVTQLIFSISNRDVLPGWGWTLASGIIDIAIGIYLIMYPAVTMVTLPYFVGFWLMFRAFYIMGISFDLNNWQVPGWGWVLTGGILLVILSWLILYYPVAGAAGIVAVSGVAFLTAGILSIVVAFKLRNIKETVKKLV